VSFNQHDERNTDRETAEAKVSEQLRVPGAHGLDHIC